MAPMRRNLYEHLRDEKNRERRTGCATQQDVLWIETAGSWDVLTHHEMVNAGFKQWM